MEVCRPPGTAESVDDFQKCYYDDNNRVIRRVRRSTLTMPSVDTRKDLSGKRALGRDSADQGAGSSAILGRIVVWLRVKLKVNYQCFDCNGFRGSLS